VQIQLRILLLKEQQNKNKIDKIKIKNLYKLTFIILRIQPKNYMICKGEKKRGTVSTEKKINPIQ
jgi:hypothetical protein